MDVQDDVARVIRAVQPDAVVLELCKARINILHTDEAKVQVFFALPSLKYLKWLIMKLKLIKPVFLMFDRL